DSPEQALEKAVALAGARAQGKKVVVAIDHAAAPERAARAAELAKQRWDVARIVTTELSATVGAQLGPGAVGIGVAPALQ
ncbi:MAG: DegV family protein, partial [Hyphomicrobiales bacterium]